ncbi:MAG TPA: DUF4340 domain-containing protein [Opitutus sp.]|nr:DUF4340 domain-containing protein [Opitutus sp.]
MRTKVTLVLLFLNVALFFFIFHFERRWRTEESWREARRRVLGTETADIRTLAIVNNSARDRPEKLALARRGDTWFVTAPIEWPANPAAVSRIVSELQFLEHETSFAVRDLAKNGQSLADYGLEHPRLTVAFGGGEPGTPDAAAPATMLRIGDTTRDGQRLYVLSPDGERIHVVNESFGRSLALGFEQIRSDAIFTIHVYEARSLNLQTAAPANLRIRIRRDGSRWTFETPIIARASKTETELAINKLDALRVHNFLVDNPPATLPSEKPALRISLEGNNRRETLLLGDAVPPGASPAGGAKAADTDYYAQFEGRAVVFTVAIPADLRDVLDHAEDKLRETRVLYASGAVDFDPNAVTAVTLSAPGQPPLTLQRLETGARSVEDVAWQIVLRSDSGQGPQTLLADRAAVGRLLQQLAQLTATGFQTDAPRDADLEAFGFNRPEREITFTMPGKDPVTLQIGVSAQRDGPAYARVTTGSVSIYTINPDILREIPTAPRAWRQHLLRELPAGARITALKLTDLADNRVLVDTAIDAAGHPATGTPAPDAVETILGQLRTLRAEEFVLDHFAERVTVAGEERPWRYQLEATITLTGGAGEQTNTTTLFLTPRVGGDRQLAGSPEFNAVFAVEQPLIDALFRLTEGPRDPGAPQ